MSQPDQEIVHEDSVTLGDAQEPPPSEPGSPQPNTPPPPPLKDKSDVPTPNTPLHPPPKD